jgi:hypothetical protein
MKRVVLEPTSAPSGSSTCSAPAKGLAGSLSEALSKIGRLYYGPAVRNGCGWEFAVSFSGLHYVFVVAYVHETRTYLLSYETSPISSLIFWWLSFSKSRKVADAVRNWAGSNDEIKEFHFFNDSQLHAYERERIAQNGA